MDKYKKSLVSAVLWGILAIALFFIFMGKVCFGDVPKTIQDYQDENRKGSSRIQIYNNEIMLEKEKMLMRLGKIELLMEQDKAELKAIAGE